MDLHILKTDLALKLGFNTKVLGKHIRTTHTGWMVFGFINPVDAEGWLEKSGRDYVMVHPSWLTKLNPSLPTVKSATQTDSRSILSINRLNDGRNVWYHITIGKWYLILSKKSVKVFRNG